MLSGGRTNHERFDELCALAAIGEVSVYEQAQLKAHMEVCAQCQIARAEYVYIVRNGLRFLAAQTKSRHHFNLSYLTPDH